MEFYVVVSRKLVNTAFDAAARRWVEEMPGCPVVAADAQLVVSAIVGRPRWRIFRFGTP